MNVVSPLVSIDRLEVHHVADHVKFIGYAVAAWPMSIWYRRGWGLAGKATIDGLIYGLITAGVFGAMWPA